MTHDTGCKARNAYSALTKLHSAINDVNPIMFADYTLPNFALRSAAGFWLLQGENDALDKT